MSKLILVFFIIFLLIIFVYLSFKTLNSNYKNFISFLLRDISKEKNNISLVKNFNYLVSNVSFEDKKNIVSNKIIYLYNTDNFEKYSDNTTILTANQYLQNNLKKLGIKVFVEDKKNEFFTKNKEMNSYYINIQRDFTDDTKITIDNKDYAKILFVLEIDNSNYLNNKIIFEKMNDYLNNNYPGLSRGILEMSEKEINDVYNYDLGNGVLLILLGGVSNNKEEVYNSTEIIALMIYNLLGDS